MKTNCLPKRARFLSAAFFAVWCLVFSVHAVPPWGTPYVQPGIAAVTCAAPAFAYPGYTPLPQSSSYAFGVMDLRVPPAAAYSPNLTAGALWLAPCYHDPQWNVTDLGNVYGVALKPDGEVFLAAHGLYGAAMLSVHARYGNIGGGANNLLAAGTVYRINQTTGAPTVFTQIPGQQNMSLNFSWTSGPGLGNVAYDARFNQFFVTSLEDGKIYRVSGAGAVLNSHDPLAADTGAAGMPPLNDRIWGIAAYGTTVYYGTWNVGTAAANANHIRKVDLNGSGDFISGSDASLLTLPLTPGVWHSVAVASLAFSKDGSLLLAGERTMLSDISSYNHQSRAHRILTSTWTVNSSLKTGNNTAVGGEGECYGGVTFGQEGGVDESIIWMTSADMAAQVSGNSPGPHGVFGVRPVNFPAPGPAAFTPNAFKVPFDPLFTSNGPDNKGSGGDIEIMQQRRDCEVKVRSVRCPENLNDPYTAVLSISNFSTKTAQYVVLNPCPVADLPPGAVTVQPAPAFTTLTPPLTTGGSTSLNIALPGMPLTGVKVCFLVTLLDASGNDCCTEKVCVDLPDCDCIELLDKKITCEVQADGTVKYTIVLTIRNRTNLTATPFPFYNVTFLPSPGFNPDIIPANVSNVVLAPDPILPGATGTLTFCYKGGPGPVYTNLVVHDERFDLCCSLEDLCLDLPDCGGAGKPDECHVTDLAPCCPPTPGVPGGPTATITYTICNNGVVPKTYSWTASGISPSSCPRTLTAADFTPSSGTLGPVAPGGCATVTITVRCNGWAPKDCAEFRICAGDAASPPLCCEGMVYRPEANDPAVKPAGAAGPLPVVTAGTIVPLAFTVENPSTVPLSTTLHFSDIEGLLHFGAHDGTVPSKSMLAVPITLAPGERSEITIDATIRPLGASGVPTFTDITVISARAGAPPVMVLVTPVRLSKSDTPALRAIANVRRLLNSAFVEIDVPTVAGRRYKIQQAADLASGRWIDAACQASGVDIAGDGSFTGNGGIVTCTLDCDVNSKRMFYRVALLE